MEQKSVECHLTEQTDKLGYMKKKKNRNTSCRHNKTRLEHKVHMYTLCTKHTFNETKGKKSTNVKTSIASKCKQKI